MIEQIAKKFGKNNPIFIDDINFILKDYSKARVYQLINIWLSSNELVRFDHGVYYIPTKTEFGISVLDVDKIVNRRYISKNNNIYGFYSGIAFCNSIGVTTQVPNIIEIITNNEATRLRKVRIGCFDYIVKKSRVKITKNNYKILQILEMLNYLDISDIENNKELIIEYIKKNNIKNIDIIKYIKYYPAKTIKNYILCEGENVFTRE